MTKDDRPPEAVVLPFRRKPQAPVQPKNVWDAMLQYAIENGTIKEKPRW